jgi:hypothetical protein
VVVVEVADSGRRGKGNQACNDAKLPSNKSEWPNKPWLIGCAPERSLACKAYMRSRIQYRVAVLISMTLSSLDLGHHLGFVVGLATLFECL